MAIVLIIAVIIAISIDNSYNNKGLLLAGGAGRPAERAQARGFDYDFTDSNFNKKTLIACSTLLQTVS